jgi:Family of unknown function (DUF6263)
MKKTIFFLSLCAAVGVLFAGCSKAADAGSSGGGSAASGEPADLKIKWVAGKKYVQRMSTHQQQEMNMPGAPGPMQMTMDMSQDYSISVLRELDGGGRELELEFMSVKMATQGAGQSASFDSKQDPAMDAQNPLAPFMRKMVGAHIKFLTDASGKVDKVEGLEEFLNQISGGNPAMMQSMFNEDALKRFCDFAMALPGRSVKVGDSWPVTKEVKMGAMGEMAMNLKCTFKGWEQHDGRKCARIAYTGDVTSKPGAADAPMKVDIQSGKIGGEAWFDPELGMTVDSSIDQDMTMKTTVQGQTMNSKVIQKISARLVGVSDIK